MTEHRHPREIAKEIRETKIGDAQAAIAERDAEIERLRNSLNEYDSGCITLAEVAMHIHGSMLHGPAALENATKEERAVWSVAEAKALLAELERSGK